MWVQKQQKSIHIGNILDSNECIVTGDRSLYETMRGIDDDPDVKSMSFQNES